MFTLSDDTYSYQGRSLGPEIACVFDVETVGNPVLLKHGARADVEAWWRTARAAYRAEDKLAYTCSWVLCAGRLDPDEVNRAIAHAGYAPSFLTQVAS